MAKRRQMRPKVDINLEQPIHIYSDDSEPLKDDYWLPEFKLRQSDKDILLSSTAWLTDSIINAAQKLLHKANPAVPGFQDVDLGLCRNFNIEPGEFVQILHTGLGHWNTISTIGMSNSDIQVFDSMYSSSTSTLKSQIATLLCTNENQLNLHFH